MSTVVLEVYFQAPRQLSRAVKEEIVETVGESPPSWLRTLGIDATYRYSGLANSPSEAKTLRRSLHLIGAETSTVMDRGNKTQLLCNHRSKRNGPDDGLCGYEGVAVRDPVVEGWIHF